MTCTRKWNLKTHMRRHTNDRPYACVVGDCGYTSRQHAAMTEHIRYKHTKERPYQCKFENCGRKFVTSSVLQRHSRVHTPEYAASRKIGETRIAKLLTSNGFDYRREHHVNFCGNNDGKYARVDFLILTKGRIVMLEVDEDQHRYGDYSVSCDMARMGRIVEALMLDGNTMPLFMIRFNPAGKYVVDGIPFRKSREEREAELIRVLNELNDIDGVTKSFPPLQILYMFYHSVMQLDGVITPCVCDDPEYDNTMKACCLSSIV